ncbi:hypothetical protein DFH06DRAFT_1135599 [Mycena polygramma]|nr:hypothetical protein DFH06DRAFT_1135599 [Mycena polygramma]
MQTPRLPTELERHIFELVALSRTVAIPTLVRVAQRVKIWIEPLLYRTIVVNTRALRTVDEGLLPSCTVDILICIALHPARRTLLHHVRNLMLVVESNEIDLILEACTNVVNVYVRLDKGQIRRLPSSWYPTPNHITSNPTTAVRHLSCKFTDIFPNAACDLAHMHITRLRLFDAIPAEHITDLCRRLPELTHLSFNDPLKHLLQGLLAEFPNLVLILVSQMELYESHRLDHYASMDSEPRFVYAKVANFEKDWQKGVLSGLDYWARVEQFVA